MEQALFKRLEAFTRLSEADRSAFGRLKSRTIDVAARRDVIREGDEPTHVNLVLKGWACRYKMLPDGRRSMVGFLIPGDFCDLNVYILKEMDHSVGAVTNVRVAQVAPDDLLQLMNDHPRVAQALLWHELVAAAVQREWTHNLSSRDAYERLAHLLLEMFLRMRTVDLVRACTRRPAGGGRRSVLAWDAWAWDRWRVSR